MNATCSISRHVTCYEKMDLQSRHVRAHYLFFAEKWASVRQSDRIHNNEFLFLSLRFILFHTCFLHTRHTFLLHLSTSLQSEAFVIMNNHLYYRWLFVNYSFPSLMHHRRIFIINKYRKIAGEEKQTQWQFMETHNAPINSSHVSRTHSKLKLNCVQHHMNGNRKLRKISLFTQW